MRIPTTGLDLRGEIQLFPLGVASVSARECFNW
jgi:hypothetical protein